MRRHAANWPVNMGCTLEYCQQVREAVLSIHEQNLYPSQMRVRQVLEKPGVLRSPEAAQAGRDMLQELGWKK
jgi:hypothetical protein